MTRSIPEQTLRRLTIIVAIQWMGATLGLPLLPLFLEHRGGTPSIIGFIMSAFFVAGVATQFALGHLADRFGRKKILIGSLIAYGLASMTFLLPVSASWFALTRVIQGAAAGAIEVVSISAVAAHFAEAERGRAIARILAAQLLGFAIGPVVGVVASVNSLGWAFFVTGVISLLAAVQTVRTDLGELSYDPSPLPRIQWNNHFVGALIAGAALGLMIGVQETSWTLLMHRHHASTLQIRLSWTVFCLPWVALSRAGGWLADHFNRRLVGVLGLVNGSVFLAIYPHIHNNNILLFTGSLESIGASLSMPSIASLLTQGSDDRELSRRQGLYATANTASLAVAAGISGILFTINPALPFTSIAIISMIFALSTLWWWRHEPESLALTRQSH